MFRYTHRNDPHDHYGNLSIMSDNNPSPSPQGNPNVLGSIQTNPGAGDTIGDVSGLQESRHVLGVIATNPEIIRLHELGQQIQRDNIPRQNEFLGRMLTLETAFLGGLFALLKSSPFPLYTSVTMLVLLALSMAASLAGLAPWPVKGDLNSPDEISKIEDSAKWRKDICIKSSITLYAIAIFIGIVSTIIH